MKWSREVSMMNNIPPNMSVKCLWMTAWKLISRWAAENWTIAFRPASWRRETSSIRVKVQTFGHNMHNVKTVHSSVGGVQPVCSVRSQREACPLPAKCFLWRQAGVIWELKNKTRKATEWHKWQQSPAVPMAWIVKAHVFQAMSGTRGHSSLGAVCSPTRWTVVAHTTNISTMLSENFLLKRTRVQTTALQESVAAGGVYKKKKKKKDDCITHGSWTP